MIRNSSRAIPSATSSFGTLLNSVNASDAGNYGVQLNINNVTGGQSDVLINNVVANNAGGNDGLEVNVNGLLSGDSSKIIVTNRAP